MRRKKREKMGRCDCGGKRWVLRRRRRRKSEKKEIWENMGRYGCGGKDEF